MEAFNDYTERFLATIEAMGLKDSEVVNALEDLSKGTMSKIRNARCGVSMNTLQEFCNAYPRVSSNYIITGRGSMFLDKERQDVLIKTLPRIPYDAAAGSLTDMVEGVTEYGCERIPVISAFPKYDFTIRVTGRSMEPYYFSGDEVACLRINESQFIQWGRVHVLDTTKGVVIKRIYENGDSIRCASFNPEYPDFNVPKEDIRSYNLVVGALRL
jgi:phage repressor protein C with HTH and peptisase S24 domain